MALEAGLMKILREWFQASPYAQPLSMGANSFLVGDVPVSYQRNIIWAVAVVLIVLVGLFLTRTTMGRAIRATAQNRDAARLMGGQGQAGLCHGARARERAAGVAGIMLTSFKDIVPLMGQTPMLKAFIVIVLAGLGNMTGALYAALPDRHGGVGGQGAPRRQGGASSPCSSWWSSRSSGAPPGCSASTRSHGNDGSTMKSRDYIFFAILLALAAAFPFMGIPRYIIASALLLFCYATVVSQWNLVFGVAGIFSLAQLAIFGLRRLHDGADGPLPGPGSLWPTFPVAGAAGVVFSFFIGLACLRMRGIYVALLTLAISQTMFVLIQTDSNCSALNKAINPSTCVSFTGGAQGLGGLGTFGWRAVLGVRNWMIGDYYSMLGLLIVALVFTVAMTQSRIGLAFKALRDNEELATSRGERLQVPAHRLRGLVLPDRHGWQLLRGTLRLGRLQPRVLPAPSIPDLDARGRRHRSHLGASPRRRAADGRRRVLQGVLRPQECRPWACGPALHDLPARRRRRRDRVGQQVPPETGICPNTSNGDWPGPCDETRPTSD